ncbi:Vesicle-associated membrane protein-associated protein A (VAMP-A) (VAMP-associated protein A) (VAP-A), partial [Durusdinium trenchii]
AGVETLKRARMSREQLIELSPDGIVFSMEEKEPSVFLKVKNVSDQVVAFKVKTTHPKRYLVRPNQDVIPSGRFSSVKISLQIKDAKALRQQRITGLDTQEQEYKDNKFLVQCVAVTGPPLDEIEELRESGKVKELGMRLKDMWTETTKDAFVNKKLTCSFHYPEDISLLREVNNLEGNVPFAGSAGEHGSDKARLAADGPESFPSGAASTDDVGELRKKYNELINFTVQLTAERDRYKANLKEAAKEVTLLKRGKASSASASAASRAGEGSLDSDISGVESVAAGFSMFHIMLVAVVAFLMGRLLV